MENQEKKEKLNKALSIIDNMLLDAEDINEIKILYRLQENVNSVYTAICEEDL